MPLYQYVKAPPVAIAISRRKPFGISFAFMGLGGAILLWVLWPILSFSAFHEGIFSQIITPVTDIQKNAYAASPSETLIASTGTDFANANVWYPTSPQKRVASEVTSYTLSIPKLKINNALVIIAGDDLSSSLIHYGGTGLPGQYGNAVIFGHSMLPQFYSPTNYKSIFSLLPTLKLGDEILVTYDDVQYRYTIAEMVVLDPSDLSVLEQRFDGSHITLVTCVPPGTYWKRLNVRATLQTI